MLIYFKYFLKQNIEIIFVLMLTTKFFNCFLEQSSCIYYNNQITEGKTLAANNLRTQESRKVRADSTFVNSSRDNQ